MYPTAPSMDSLGSYASLKPEEKEDGKVERGPVAQGMVAYAYLSKPWRNALKVCYGRGKRFAEKDRSANIVLDHLGYVENAEILIEEKSPLEVSSHGISSWRLKRQIREAAKKVEKAQRAIDKATKTTDLLYTARIVVNGKVIDLKPLLGGKPEKQGLFGKDQSTPPEAPGEAPQGACGGSVGSSSSSPLVGSLFKRDKEPATNTWGKVSGAMDAANSLARFVDSGIAEQAITQFETLNGFLGIHSNNFAILADSISGLEQYVNGPKGAPPGETHGPKLEKALTTMSDNTPTAMSHLGSFANLAGHLNATAERLPELVPKIERAVDSVAYGAPTAINHLGKFADLAENLNAAAGKFPELVDEITKISRPPKAADALSGHILSFVMVLQDLWGWGFTLFQACTAQSVAEMMGILTSAACLKGWFVKLMKIMEFKALVERTCEVIITKKKETEEAGPEKQSMVEFSDLVEPLSGLIAMAVCATTGDKVSLRKLSDMSMKAKALMTIRSFKDAVVASVKQAHDFLYSIWTGFSRNVGDLPLRFEDWLEEVNSTVLSPDWMRDMFSAPGAADVLQKLLEQGETIHKEIREGARELREKISPELVRITAVLRNTLKILMSAKSPAARRVEPWFLVLSGGTSVGKTTAVGAFAFDLFARDPERASIVADDEDKLVYSKSSSSPYFEGYDGQFVYFIDELFQSTMKEVNADELQQIFTCVNTYSAPLNMANVDHKGKVIFSSKGVIGTTNRTHWDGFSIVSNEALHRRVDFFVEMVVKKEFANEKGHLDAQKWFDWCAANEQDPSKPRHADFLIKNLVTNNTDRTVSYDELLEMITEVRKKKFNVHKLISKGRSEEFQKMRQEDAGKAKLNEELELLDIVKQAIKPEKQGLGESIRTAIYRPFFEQEIPQAFWHNVFENWVPMQKSQNWYGILYLSLYTHFDNPKYFEDTYKLVRRPISFETYKQVAAKFGLALPTPVNKIKNFWNGLKANFTYSNLFIGLAALAGFFGTIGLLAMHAGRNGPRPGGYIRDRLWPKKTDTESKTIGEWSNKRANRMRHKLGVRESEHMVSDNVMPSQDWYGPNYSRVQGTSDPEFDPVANKVLNNMVRATLKSASGIRKSGSRAIMVNCYCCVIPSHLLDDHIESDRLELEGVTVKKTFNLRELRLTDIGMRFQYDDVTMILLPQPMPSRDIVKLFATDSDVRKLKSFDGSLLVPGDGITTRFHGMIDTIEEAQKKDPDLNTRIDDYLTAAQGWVYDFPTKKGDCGSPLLIYGSAHPRKIVGIHSAGSMRKNGDGSLSCIVTQESLKAGLKSLGFTSKQCDDCDIYYNDGETNVHVVGKAPVKAFFPMGKTSIETSPLARYLPWKPKKTPAAVNTVTMDSVKKMFAKYSTEVPAIEESKIRLIVQALYCRHFSGPEERRLFTFDETLNVIGQTHSVDMSTSAGYPLCVRGTKKTDLIDYKPEEQRFFFKDPEFLEHLEEMDRQLAKGEIDEQIFLIYAKDELLPIEKVQEGKVRLFAASPFDLVLLFRRYFSCFANVVMDRRFEHGIMVGIDPHTEFSELYTRLVSKNRRIFEFDYKWWDGTIPYSFLEIFFHVADLFYGTEHQRQRNLLKRCVLDPTYQLNYMRYKTACGQPSGNPMSALINSFANIGLFYYCMLSQGIPPELVFNETYGAVYGDDGCMAIAYDFSVRSFLESVSSLGMKVTSPRKDSEVGFADILEVEFLKRRFVISPHGYVEGALNLDSIRESLLWVKKGVNKLDNIRSTVRSAMIELGHHHPAAVVEDYKAIVKACYPLGIVPPVTEHMLASFSTKKEALDGTMIQKMWLGFLGTVWNVSLSYPKKPVEIDSLPKSEWIECLYEGVDIGAKLPMLPSNVFRHVDFKIEGRHVTFSDTGVVTIPDYGTDFSYPVKISREALLNNIRQCFRYHKTRFNCIDWCEKVLKESGQDHWDHAYDLKKYAMKYLPELMDKKQSDNIGELETNDPVVSPERHLSDDVDSILVETRTISELLENPLIVASGKWTIGHAAGRELEKIVLPNALFSSSQIKSKTEHYSLMRTDVELTIKVASTPFHSGMLMGYWVPMEHYGYPGDGGLNYLAATAMNHVRISAASQQLAVVRIPFIHSKNFIRPMINLNENESMGAFHLTVLNNLKGADNSAVPYKITANLVGTVLAVPTPLKLDAKWPATTGSRPSIARKQADEAREKSEEGIISGPATSLSGIAKLVSNIPVFSAPAAVIRTAADTVAAVTRAVGLSKPLSIESTKPVIPRPFTCVSLRDGLDMSIPLSTTIENSVGLEVIHFGSRVDEMNLEYLLRTPQVVAQVSWSHVHPAGAELWSAPVTPALSSFSSVKDFGQTVEVYQPTPLSFISMAAQFWRGPIRFGFEVVCSTIHRGTLAAIFVPAGFTGTGLPALETTSHHIFDLGENQSFEVTVPYVSQQVYSKVPGPQDVLSLDQNKAIGSIKLIILNELVAPSTVAETVGINVWISAGEHFELALPTLASISQFSYRKPVSLTVAKGPARTRAEGMRDRDAWQFGPDKGTFPKIASICRDVSHLTMGERLYSVRDFLKIAQHRFTTRVDLEPGERRSLEVPVVGFRAAIKGESQFDTYLDHFLRIYRFVRGSIRHKWVFTQANVVVSAEILPKILKPLTWTRSHLAVETPWVVCVPTMNPTLEYSIPYYSERRVQVVGVDTSARGVRLSVENLGENKVTIRGMLHESIGDDFSAGFFMGPPQMSLTPTLLRSLCILLQSVRKTGTLKKIDSYYAFEPTKVAETSGVEFAGATTGELKEFYSQKMYYKTSQPTYVLFVKDGRGNPDTALTLISSGVLAEPMNYFFAWYSTAYDESRISSNWDPRGAMGLPFHLKTSGTSVELSLSKEKFETTSADWAAAEIFANPLAQVFENFGVNFKGRIIVDY